MLIQKGTNQMSNAKERFRTTITEAEHKRLQLKTKAENHKSVTSYLREKSNELKLNTRPSDDFHTVLDKALSLSADLKEISDGTKINEDVMFEYRNKIIRLMEILSEADELVS